MASERFNYQVVEVKGGLFGLKTSHLQDELNRLGQQGWELVSTAPAHSGMSVRLFLKKRL